MRGRGITPGLFGTFLATDVGAGQTPPSTPFSASTVRPCSATSPSASAGSTAGAFDKLSPGHQQIARALFQAQRRTGAPDRTAAKQPGAAPRPALLTLDRIAALKGSGLSWGQVFKQMKAQGQIEARNLGQVANNFVRGQRALSGSPRPAPTGENPRGREGGGIAITGETAPGGNSAQQAGAAGGGEEG